MTAPEFQLGQQFEHVTVPWLHGTEVATIERHDGRRADSLGERDHRRIGTPQREVRVLVDEIGDPLEVLWSRPVDVECGEAPEESNLGARPESSTYEIGRLGDDQRRHDEA